MNLNGILVVVVIGGVLGFGVVIVWMFVENGVWVIVFDCNVDEGVWIVLEIGGVFVDVDVIDQVSVEFGFVFVRFVYGQECILVNCVGIVLVVKIIFCGELYLMDLFEKVIFVNLIGLFRCLLIVFIGMVSFDFVIVDGGCGVIVLIVFVVVFDGQIGQVVYVVLKVGVVGMIFFVVWDLLKLGIWVMIIVLGIFEMLMLFGLF